MGIAAIGGKRAQELSGGFGGFLMLEVSDKVVGRQDGMAFSETLRDFAMYYCAISLRLRRGLQAAVAYVQSSLGFRQFSVHHMSVSPFPRMMVM